MEIIPAIPEHGSEITKLLVDHFVNNNNIYQYVKYKTDFTQIYKHVSARLETNSKDFQYFVLFEDDTFAGFINCMMTTKSSEILALCLKTEYDNPENAGLLLQYGIKYMKTNGAKSITLEVIETQLGLRTCISKFGGKVIEQKYII
jgi:hypothetical protein